MVNSLKYLMARRNLREDLNRHSPQFTRELQTIGVLSDRSIEIDFKPLRRIFNSRDSTITFLFLEHEEMNEDHAFSPKDLSYFGKFKSQSNASTFADGNFDLLINFWNKENDPLLILAAKTKAKLKVGLKNPEPKLNDLEIYLKNATFENFCKELQKYLKTLTDESN